MDRTQTKIYLNRYRRLEERKRQVRERLDRIEERATSTTAKLTGMPRATGTGDKVGRGATDAADYKTELQRLKREADITEAEIFFVIDAVDNANRSEVLYRHYIGGESLLDISDKMGFSYRTIIRMHLKGLDDVGKLLDL